ncbi:hypothetical protein D3C81_884360 [compost metagenome]
MLRRVEFDAQFALHVPLGEQFQLATQQGHVIARQRRNHRQLLESQQRLQGVLEQIVSVFAVDDVQIGLVAQVIEQKKTALEVFGINFRHIYSGFRQQKGDIHEGFAVFLGRRRIHHDETFAIPFPTEIPPKTRVAAGRSQRGRGYDAPALLGKKGRQLFIEPNFQVLQAYILIRHCKGLRRR